MVLQDKYDVIIVGGGISGCICASKIKDKNILIIDANDKLMKKIYATGNGRCNLTNYNLDVKNYNSDDAIKLEKIYSKYNNKNFLDYLDNIGLFITNIDGLVYPKNLQASSVVDAIKNSINSNVNILLNTQISNINIDNIVVNNRKIKFDKLILATGSTAGGINSITKNPYKLIKDTDICTPLPALCGVSVNKKYFEKLSGVRVNSKATLIIDNKIIKSEYGQTQFKKNGLSGIQIFQLSSQIARSLSSKKVFIELNYIYDEDVEKIRHILMNSKDILKNISLIVPDKLAKVLIYLAVRESDEHSVKVERLINILSSHRIEIIGVDDYKSAQTVTGGYKLSQLDDNLNVIGTNFHIIGEVLNVDGICGGYNIQWAYSSASCVADCINR